MNRDLKWLIFGLGIAALLAVIFAVFIYFIMNLIKGEAYELSLTAVSEHAAVEALIGEPIEPGLLVLGNVNISGPSGNAELQYDVSGPKGEATVYAYAIRDAGEWQLIRVIVDVDGARERFDVVAPNDSL
ncbi:cytochrome c oxidase assembly factor Coa1 family protein [Pseudidiomarina sp. E22-M8]|uniref:cytochrome c oxidase assembly factor Coa1 family protein n=1 Tax=Pseudidiomarina sp. E22-M8 TaxID=3424768 RepID=UPI00403C6462